VTKLIRTLPFSLLFLFYAWAVIAENGFVMGLHLTVISFSFFILFTPLASYFYVAGLLPGALYRGARIYNVALVWLGLLLFNFWTIIFYPAIFDKCFSSIIVYRILTDVSARNVSLALSGGFLFYHWLVTKFDSLALRTWFHLVGIGGSALAYYFLFPFLKHRFVSYIATMSASNY
jgi:hypothetical protein